MDNYVVKSFEGAEITVTSNQDGTINMCLGNILTEIIKNGEIKRMKICIDNIKKTNFHFLVGE